MDRAAPTCGRFLIALDLVCSAVETRACQVVCVTTIARGKGATRGSAGSVRYHVCGEVDKEMGVGFALLQEWDNRHIAARSRIVRTCPFAVKGSESAQKTTGIWPESVHVRPLAGERPFGHFGYLGQGWSFCGQIAVVLVGV